MKLNNFNYLIKEGIRGIFLHGFMSFAAVCVTVACLLIVGSFSSLMYNVNILVEDLNKTNEILVIIDENLPDAEARSVGTSINQIANVQQSVFVSREEALEMIRKIKGSKLLTGWRGSKPCDLDAVADIIVKVAELSEANEEIRELDINPVFVYEDGAVIADARVLL